MTGNFRVQYLIATDQRAIIIKPKLLGSESHTYPYSTLVRVENSVRMLGAFVELITAAQQTYHINWGKNRLEAGGGVNKQDLPNVIVYNPLSRREKEAFNDLKEKTMARYPYDPE